MHRTEGSNNVANLFTDGPPGTTIDAAFMNTIQEEIANVIENAGISLLTAGTDTRDQLKRAIYGTTQHWHTDNVEDISLWLTNGVTGETGADGIRLTCRSDGDAEINQYENGNLILKTNNSEAIRITNVNAAATPSLVLQGDIDTGVWHPAADTLAISNAGVETIRFNNANYIGIKTSSIGETLTVAGGIRSIGASADWSAVPIGLTIDYSGTNGRIVTYTAGGSISFHTAVGALALTLDSSQDATLAGGLSRNGQSVLNCKILDIGDWNMDTSAFVNVAHGLGADWKKIRSVQAIIRRDDDASYQNLCGHYDTGGWGAIGIDSTNIILYRTTGGFFDGSASYDDTSYNRGYVYIDYIN